MTETVTLRFETAQTLLVISCGLLGKKAGESRAVALPGAQLLSHLWRKLRPTNEGSENRTAEVFEDGLGIPIPEVVEVSVWGENTIGDDT